MSHIFILVKEESVYNNMVDIMFNDLSKRDDFISIIEPQKKFYKFFRRKKIQKLKIFNRFLVKSYELYNLLKKIENKYDNVYILFLNNSLITTKFPVDVLNKYKKMWSNIKYILFYIDIVNRQVSEHANKLRECGIFDRIYTIDAEDAKKYDMNLWYTPYSYNEKYKLHDIKCDLYFCGITKGRTNKIINILEEGKKENAKIKMDIVYGNIHEKDSLSKYTESVLLRDRTHKLKYEDLLVKTMQANCILEIVQNDQVALTLRAYEAIVYNKKLLTNNIGIRDLAFYDERYMQYYTSEEDIDWDWVKLNDNVDYKYNGEFSPIRLIEDIEAYFE